jgi:hypothetical protein
MSCIKYFLMLHREFIAVCAEIHKQQESQQTNIQTHSQWTERGNLRVKTFGV